MKHLLAIAVILVIALFIWLCPPEYLGLKQTTSNAEITVPEKSIS